MKDSGDADSINLYLAKYPNGYFVDLANAKLGELKGGTKVASAETAPDALPITQRTPSEPIAIIGMPAQTIYASTAGAQVRAAPSKSAEVLSKLRTNEEMVATGETKDGQWWRVKVGDSDGFISKSVASAQPVAQATTAQAPQPQGSTQTAQLQTAETDARGLEMMGGAAPVPANGADVQALGQVAGAVQSGNIASGLNSLGNLFGGGQQQADLPQVQFQPMNKTVTVKKGALIRANPVYNAASLARASQDTRLQATGRTANNLWWSVVLPDGNVGYVEGRLIGQ